MAEKKKVKYTPPRDETIPKELKRAKPMSSAAAAQEDIEENLPESTRKEEGSEESLSKIQDELKDKKITSKEAHKKAGIKLDDEEEVKVEPKPEVKKEDPKKKAKEVEEKAKKEKKKKEKEPKEFKKITLEDGHTYLTAEKDAVCSNCLLPKNKTTTQCFKQEIFPVALIKFNKGLIDYVKGVWITLPEKSK